ncbi:MAG: 4-(cytidine 5'-diphospho)-2-C-methyl-D-erythritol kinase [Thermodesulfobacteriota bacterium]|nr:4-(cytidine 5'-diphospho)-2-C-methyl-D-erythritol kinase [Thermodesulfobacteriota bacterium]
MSSLSLLAPAKINLFLLIKGRRPDGYHLIFTMFQKISLWDEIELFVEQGKKKGIYLECPDSELISGPDNLAYQAAELFLEKVGLDLVVKILLKKRIPIGGGLGGGSSDAASVLKGLNELTGFPLNAASLHLLGCSLGSDVPFFLLEAPAAVGRGVGTELEVINVPHGWYVLVYPGFSISTRWAYENYVLTGQDQDTIFDTGKVIQAAMWLNDLEKVVMAGYPEIGRIKDDLVTFGAEAALMSGSGSTVLGAFLSQEAGRLAASSIEVNRGLHTLLVESL